MPVKGLNLFSRSNCCFPRTPRSTCRSGQIAYSSIVLLIWKILSVIASGAGPENRTANNHVPARQIELILTFYHILDKYLLGFKEMKFYR